MPRLRVARVAPCTAARFAGLERGLLSRAGGEAVLLLAELAGPALLLGRFQRAASALRLGEVRAAGLPLARRACGGRTLLAAEGTLGVFLSVPPGTVFFAGPVAPERVMNRAVRGLLQGLRLAGAASAAYFGRDFVSASQRQVAAVSQEGTEEGGMAFEAVVATAGPLGVPPGLTGYPHHSNPRAGGPPAGAVLGPAGEPRGAAAVAELVVRGYAEAGSDPEPWEGPLPDGGELPAEEEEQGLSGSGVADVPIGFAEALVRAEAGKIVEARLRGDFIAPAFAVLGLERALAGCPLAFPEVGRRVDDAFRRPHAFVHGLTGLGILAEAVLAAGRAGAGP